MDTENLLEAERAKKEGMKYLQSQNYKKAAKMFEISLRIHNNDDTKQYLNSAKAGIARVERNSRSTSADEPVNITSSESSSSTWSLLSYINARINALESKYISPSLRMYVRTILLIILVLATVRFYFKSELSLGHLPGDISYNSPNLIISAPIVSCMLFSFLLNAIRDSIFARV